MARHYTIYIQKQNIPLRKALQSAITGLGYKLTIEDEYVPFASSGYLACTLNGEDAGLMWCALSTATATRHKTP